MATTQKEMLIAWLNDAYAMEKGLVEILESHSKDAAEYPQVQEKIDKHMQLTEEHAERIEECITSLGGNIATIKSGMAQLVSMAQGAVSHFPSDSIVKNAIAEFSAEHMEIAAYTALITAAQELGEDGIARICSEIRDQEQEAADWLEKNIPIVTSEFMTRSENEEKEE